MNDVNILIDELPTTIEVDGKSVDINYDFRYGIMFEQMLTDNTIPENEKPYIMIDLFLDHSAKNVHDFDGMIDKILWFYRCGKKQVKKDKPQEGVYVPPSPIYDFDYDADLIYSAFMQQYQIDLNNIELHWWKFKTLFNCLDENTFFKQIVHIRSMNPQEINDVEARAKIVKLKIEYKIPIELTDEQKYIMAGNLFGGDFGK